VHGFSMIVLSRGGSIVDETFVRIAGLGNQFDLDGFFLTELFRKFTVVRVRGTVNINLFESFEEFEEFGVWSLEFGVTYLLS